MLNLHKMNQYKHVYEANSFIYYLSLLLLLFLCLNARYYLRYAVRVTA